MNIFVLDYDPHVAATYHNDRHCVKMILESAQILCTALHLVDPDFQSYYKPTHRKHPCTIWATQSVANFRWLAELGLALCKEYTLRYGKKHKTQYVLESLVCHPSKDKLPFCIRTPFAQAMPEDCKHPYDAVIAYRKYYMTHKQHLASWRVRGKPWWYEGENKVHEWYEGEEVVNGNDNNANVSGYVSTSTS